MGARDECCWELLLSTCCVQYTVSDMKNWLLLQPIQLSCAPIYVKQKEESKREHAGVCAELSINTRFSVGLCIVWLQFAKSYQEFRILKKLCFSLSLTHQHAFGGKKDFRLVCLLNIHDSISLKCDIQSVSLVICELEFKANEMESQLLKCHNNTCMSVLCDRLRSLVWTWPFLSWIPALSTEGRLSSLKI